MKNNNNTSTLRGFKLCFSSLNVNVFVVYNNTYKSSALNLHHIVEICVQKELYWKIKLQRKRDIFSCIAGAFVVV